nr:hypothetical protein [Campylobacter sp.]
FVYFNNIDSNNSGKMLASLNLDIKALNNKGSELKNFTKECYAKDIAFKVRYDSNTSELAIFDENRLYDDKDMLSFLNDNKMIKEYDLNSSVKVRTIRSDELKDAVDYNASKEHFGSQAVHIGFNFARNNETAQNPLFIKSDAFKLENFVLSSPWPANKINLIEEDESDSLLYVLYGRQFIPHADIKSEVKTPIKEYYAFYSDEDFNDDDIKGDEVVTLNYWYINKAHTKADYGLADIQIEGVGDFKPQNLSEGVREIEISRMINHNDRVFTIKSNLINFSWLLYKNFDNFHYSSLLFYNTKENSWNGVSYDRTSKKQENAKDPTITNTNSPKNRRIQW